MANRSLKWAIALSSLVCPIALISVVHALPREPDYFCYDVDPSQGVRNLNDLCAQNPPLPPKPSPSPSPSLAPSTVQEKIMGNVPTRATAKNNEPIGPQKASPAKPVEVKPDAKKIFEFSELSYEDRKLLGSVKNKTRQPMSNSHVNFKVYKRKDASNWQLIDAGRASVMDDNLLPGKSSPFEASPIKDGDKVVITSVN